MKLNVAILEDNNKDFEHLSTSLIEWGTQTKNIISITRFENENIITAITFEKYNLIFSDIELKTSSKYTGIKICEELRKRGYSNEIIFTTSFREYVFDGYNVQAFNYLIKPISLSILSSCMKRYIDLHERNYYYLQDRSSLIQLQYSDILYVEKQGHNILFHTINAIYYERNTLHNVTTKLPIYFKMCHKSFIININHISSISSNKITLSNNDTLNIGRTYLVEIRNALFELSNY